MSGIKFVYDNYVLSSDVTLTTGTENAQFPLNNLKKEATVRKFRSTGNSVVIEFDLLQTRNIDFIGINGDATGTFGITAASAKTSATTDFSLSPQIDIDLSVEQNMGYKIFTEVSHRYVELTLTGNGSYSELGSVFIGAVTNLPQNNLALQSFSYKYIDPSKIDRNEYGTKFIDNLPKIKMLSGSLETCTKDEQETVDDMVLFLGRTTAFWVLIDSDGNGMNSGKYKLTMYSYLVGMTDWSARGGQHYSAGIDMEAVV